MPAAAGKAAAGRRSLIVASLLIGVGAALFWLYIALFIAASSIPRTEECEGFAMGIAMLALTMLPTAFLLVTTGVAWAWWGVTHDERFKTRQNHVFLGIGVFTLLGYLFGAMLVFG